MLLLYLAAAGRENSSGGESYRALAHLDPPQGIRRRRPPRTSRRLWRSRSHGVNGLILGGTEGIPPRRPGLKVRSSTAEPRGVTSLSMWRWMVRSLTERMAARWPTDG